MSDDKTLPDALREAGQDDMAGLLEERIAEAGGETPVVEQPEADPNEAFVAELKSLLRDPWTVSA